MLELIAVVLAQFICFVLITRGECILTPVPLIYPASTATGAESGGDNSTHEGGGGWRPSPEFITPQPGSRLVRTKLGLNVTAPVKRHVYEYSGEYSPHAFKYPPYSGEFDGNWPPVRGYAPGPGPIPVPGNGYQNYPVNYSPLAVRPHIPQELLLKSLLVPLTGAALLGVAAFLVSNPVLIKLGVIAGRRRRRGAVEPVNQSNQSGKIDHTVADFLTLQRFMKQFPDEETIRNRNRMVANYLTCSGLLSNSKCLESLACQTALTKRTFSSTLEEKVIHIVMDEIMLNTFVSQDVKKRIKRAQNHGLMSENCSLLICTNLDMNSFCGSAFL